MTFDQPLNTPRIWFDVLTPKQVLFFSPIIDYLKKHGCQVLATSRKYREVEPIAELTGIQLDFVGKRGGGDPAEQLYAATERQLEIIPLVRQFGPTVAVSVASSVCARVAIGLRTRHIAINDSPHSEVAGRLSLPLSHHLFCPWIIPSDAWLKFGLSRSQITRYHALDPAVWLKRPPTNGPIPALRRKSKTITVRLEETYAPYMMGTNRNLPDLILEGLADQFGDANIVILCRYGDQLDAIKREFSSKFIIPEGTVDGRHMLEKTDLFVGMGGTMSTEAALMGVPTISAFQGVLLTELFLESRGLLVKTKHPNRIMKEARKLLSEKERDVVIKKAKRILDSMEDPVPKIANYLVRLAEDS